jgi:hypothetical protein
MFNLQQSVKVADYTPPPAMPPGFEGRPNSSWCVSRPFGTNPPAALIPNVETLGYCRMSLRDRNFAQLTHARLLAQILEALAAS